MSCYTSLKNPIITVNLVTKDKIKLYVFIGQDVSDNIKKICSKIENKKSLTNSEESEIKKLSKKYKTWEKHFVKFIYDYIRLDDSMNTLKKKIFIHASDINRKYFVLEKNQELWLEISPKKYDILGYHYVNKDTGETLNIQPSIYSKVEIDYKFVNKDGFPKDVYDLVNEDLILYDILYQNKILGESDYSIYVSNLSDFIKRLEKHKITTISDKLLNGFIKKHWPEATIETLISENLKHYKETKILLERDNKIINLVENVKINKDQFSSCNIMQARIHINYNSDKDMLDLLKLFNFLRKNLSYDMPFIKYKDPEWIKPYSIAYDKALKEKLIDESKLIQWIGLAKTKDMLDIKVQKGITIKLKTYEFNKKPFYGTLNINKKGRIEFSPSYINEFQTSIHNVIENVDLVSNLIKLINKSDALLNTKIEEPGLKFENNILVEKTNTRIISLTTMSDYKPTTKMNYKDFLTFSKLFTPYISYKLDKVLSETKLTLLYKRVSNFVNMTDIYKRINEMITAGISDSTILSEIVNKYDKTVRDAILLLNDYKKRYGGYTSYNLIRQPGITSSLNFNTDKITINSAPEFFLLINANKFMYALVTIYENRMEYAKNKDFRHLIMTSEEYIKLQEKEMVDVLSNIEENINANLDLENLENIEDVDIDDEALTALNIDEYLEEMNKVNDILNKNENVINKNEGLANYIQEQGLATDDEVDPNIKLSCEDPLPELDTCKDLCNDKNYFLRRLQRYDPKLFNYSTPSEKYSKYSKACQANNDFQPVVMRHNPEHDPEIDRKSFTYALKYGSSSGNQNYYICPKAWCPYHQKPILFEKIKNIRKRMTVEGRCTIGTCPYGDHDVFIFTKGPYVEKKYDHGLYPGFTSSMHPDNLCLPCCFRRPQTNPSSSKHTHYKKCLGEETDTQASEENIRYIFGYQKILQEERYGLLPPDISKLFGTQCEQGFIKKSCYLRKGVAYVEKQGFLSTIADIVSEDRPISLDELKNYLVDKLTPKLFKSLNGGSLEIVFKLKNKNVSAIENYKAFLKSDEKIDEKYLWDYLSRPGILYPEGINIVLFTEETLICPLGFNIKEFYSFSRKTVFMIKYIKHYTPIYYIKFDEGEIAPQKYFSIVNKVVLNILLILKNNCIEMSSINWKKIFKDNEKKYGIAHDINVEKEFSTQQTITFLEEMKSVKVKSQLIDFYNKTVALLLDNGTYLPVLPSAILLDLDIILMDNIQLLDYKTLKYNLNEIDKKTKINCKPIYKILSDNGTHIIAILLNTNRIVPTKPSTLVSDDLPIKDIPYYKNANRAIYEDAYESNKRTDTVNKMEYETESYNRIRFELSKYLQKHESRLNAIKNIAESKESLTTKRKDMKTIITPILKDLISTKDLTKDNKIDFGTYKTPNVRTICFENIECTDDPHCVKDGTKCKLHIFSKNLLTGKDNMKTYTEILVEELVRNRMKREDILDDKISNIIDKQKIVPEENEIVFFGKFKNDTEKIDDIYHKEQHIFINTIQPFDTLEPKYYGIDKEYREIDIGTEETVNLEPLSIYWSQRLGDNYMVFKTKDGSLFDAITRGLNYIAQDQENKQTTTKLHQRLSEYDVPEDVIMKIATEMGLKISGDNNDEQDLILKLYKMYDRKFYKDITSVADLKSYIIKQGYYGSLVDIYLLSEIFNINIIVLDKRLKKHSEGITIIRQPDSKEYMLLYAQFSKDRYLYDIITKSGKYIFEKYDFSDRFRAIVNDIEDKKSVPKIEAKVIGKKIKIKKLNNKNNKNLKKVKIKKVVSPKIRKIKIKK